MKHHNQLEKKDSKIASDCHGLYAASYVMDHTQPTTKYWKKIDNNLTPPWTVHGMNDHASYAPSSATDRTWHHWQRIIRGMTHQSS